MSLECWSIGKLVDILIIGYIAIQQVWKCFKF